MGALKSIEETRDRKRKIRCEREERGREGAKQRGGGGMSEVGEGNALEMGEESVGERVMDLEWEMMALGTSEK